MSDSSDPYQIWLSQPTSTPASVAPRVPASVELPPDRRGFRILAGVGLAALALLLTTALLLWHGARTRSTTERVRQAEQREAAFSARAAARTAAAEAAAVANLAQRQAVEAGSPDSAGPILARLAAGAAGAQQAADAAETGSAMPATEAERAARTSLEGMRADAAAISQLLEATRQSREAAGRTALAAQNEAQARELQAAREREREERTASVNRALWRPGSVVVAIVDADNKPVWAAMDELGRRLSTPGRAVPARLLTPVFFTTPLAPHLITQGPPAIARPLELPAERAIVGRFQSTARPPDQFGFITTDCVLEVTIFDAAGSPLGAIRWEAAGAGPDIQSSAAQALAKVWATLDWSRFHSHLSP